ncbi:alkaline phosphatase family protein [Thermoplasma sp.]|uniref:alkaline phosphatase family protein n=1 Tax=Thermoplasma sp. TaxID=1973142 RepID=UPI00260DDEDD|nr:alkaline phosphatase family protein [Thermoplasma sp.]
MRRVIVILIISLFMITLISPAVSAQASSQTKTPIKHVIAVLFENHTFDNFFGIYPYDNASWNESIIRNMTVPENLIGTGHLSQLRAVPNGVYSTPDPVEGYTAYHLDWNHGKMNNFINGSGPQSMEYYTSYQLGLEWSIASEYAIADRYFAPQLSESAPNTLYYIAGFSPVINDYGPPPSFPMSETIFGELSHYGISWNIYVQNNTTGNFDNMQHYISNWNQYSGHLLSWSDLISEAQNNSLPAVSYVFSEGPPGFSQAPPSNVEKGEIWLAYLINQIEESPSWNSTAIFVTYDDPGGFYDQVDPPMMDGVQLGMRLPMILVSPFAKEDYVSNTVMTHTSIIAFIDYNWGIPALNKFVSLSNIPLDMFDFSVPYKNGYVARPPIDLQSEQHLPPNLHFSIDPKVIDYNFSGAFPFAPQYSYSVLPYSREGASNVTLSSLHYGIFIEHDISYTPFYYSPAYFIIIAVVGAVLFWIGGEVYERNRRH